MFTLKQGKRRMSDFSIGFWIRLGDREGGESPIGGLLLHSLTHVLSRELTYKKLPSSLISMCIRMDDHMHEYGKPNYG